jgi:hypothetical protein
VSAAVEKKIIADINLLKKSLPSADKILSFKPEIEQLFAKKKTLLEEIKHFNAEKNKKKSRNKNKTSEKNQRTSIMMLQQSRNNYNSFIPVEMNREKNFIKVSLSTRLSTIL